MNTFSVCAPVEKVACPLRARALDGGAKRARVGVKRRGGAPADPAFKEREKEERERERRKE